MGFSRYVIMIRSRQGGRNHIRCPLPFCAGTAATGVTLRKERLAPKIAPPNEFARQRRESMFMIADLIRSCSAFAALISRRTIFRKGAHRYLWAIAPIVFAIGFSRTVLGGSVRIYPAPSGEPLSTDFKVTVDQRNVPVYLATVATADPAKRKRISIGDYASYADHTSFVSFDLQGSAKISITCPKIIKNATVLPASARIIPAISGHSVVFTVSKPGQLELDVNGDWVHSLQVFINPLEKNVPSPGDPNVIYFGPGIHEVDDMRVGSGKTVYLAAGAVIYGKVKPQVKSRNHVTAITELDGGAVFSLVGNDIKLCGRGIIDGSLCPGHTRNLISVSGKNISVEGVILRDSGTWTLPIQRSDHVTVNNIKIFGYRGNSDGIDICNSRNVRISNCFIRTMDDLVVVKTPIKDGGESRNITVKGCILWNELADALSIGAELRENVRNVHFSDCDIVHDKGREWLMRIYHCDAADVADVTFDNICADESKRLIALWIGKAVWSKDERRGHIEDVTFRNIRAVGKNLAIDLKGFDGGHEIKNVLFQDLLINGKRLKASTVRQNKFVQGVEVKP